MKTTFTFLSAFVLSFTTAFAQQYGWVDISSNLPSGTGTSSLSDLYFVNDIEGWICSGALGEIYHTPDGGSTYTTQTTQYYTNAIHMLNSNEGYSGGQNGRVYRTTDGGGTWSVHGSIGGTLLSINFPPSSTTGYCSGYTGRIYSITSTGVSSMYTGLSSNLSSISFPTTSQGWACGGTIITHYNGTSWTSDQAYPSETYTGICMINNTTGWAVGSNGVIINTTDGLNWIYQTNPDTSNRSLNDVFFLDTSNGWAVGNGGVILHTTNGGDLWTIEGAGMTTNMLRAVQFTSLTNGYVLGNNKTLFKYTLLTDVEEQTAKPTAFKLEQNYPNPFNPDTKINYSLSVPAHVTLTVYDILGHNVCVLVNERKPAGNFSEDFKGSSLPGGIYYYQLKAGNRSETRKMILMN